MSIKRTKQELESVESSKHSVILPSVFELRFVKMSITGYGAEHSLWIYMGRSSDYLIVPDFFCSCKDFIIRTAISKVAPYCKHLIGVRLAIKERKYLEFSTDMGSAAQIVQEVLDKGFSPTLRKLIYSSKPKG